MCIESRLWLTLLLMIGIGFTKPLAGADSRLGPLPESGLASLDLPLTIHEVAGVARKQDLCSTGVPLPCGLLREPQGIAVFDSAGKAVPAQFRVLERWRDKGEGRADLSIRWLLVTFLADVPAGGSSVYKLKAGNNPLPPQPVEIADKGQAWQLGGMQFRKDFSSPFRLVFTDVESKTLTAAELPVTWSVWESGPLRACLKAESPTIAGKFGFIAWIYAYAGQQRWDMTVVLKNTPQEMHGPLYFKDFSVVWEPAEVRGGDFLLGGQWGKNIAGKVAANQSASLFQDSDGTDFWETFGKNWEMSPVLDYSKEKSKARAGRPAFRGYQVTSGGKEVGRGDFAAGWAALSDGKTSAFAAVRDYYQQYPKATELTAGKIIQHLWPSSTQAFGGVHWLDDSTRKAHDLTFRIGPQAGSPEQAETMSRGWDFPLLAHAPAEWYFQTGVVRPSPDHASQKEFTGAVIRAQTGTGRNWVNFGGDVTDPIRRRYHGADLDGFARTGDPSQGYQLYRTARHSSGMTPLWLDDYQYPRDVNKLTHDQYCGLARPEGSYRPGTVHHGYKSWNDSHFVCQEVFDNWRLRGDPLALDALTTIGHWCQAYVDFREANPGKLIAGTRADGLPFYNLCEAYRVLGDESMRHSMDRFAAVCWKQVDKRRGNYGVMDLWEGGKDRCEKPFMMSQVIQGLRGYYELTGDPRTADQIYGMVDFIVQESSMGPWGFNYVVLTDPGKNPPFLAEKRAAAEANGKNISYGQIAWAEAWAYRHFGDERFRAAIDGINVKAYPYVSRAYTGYYPERAVKTPPPAITDLTAEPLGGGRSKLSWTSPTGQPVRYQVKWADRPMVERVDWLDKQAARANWWSANVVTGEPAPSSMGTRQSMVVEGLPSGRLYFAIRSFDAESNRSAISNLAEVAVH